MEPLTQEEIDVLWKELQSDYPLTIYIPDHWMSFTRGLRDSIIGTAAYWEWNATQIMLVLAANDALDIQE